MEAIKTYTYGNKTLEVYQDNDPLNPRDWDNIGKMICHHNRYNLGDKHNINPKDYNNFAEMKADIIRKEDVAIMLPMYMYDHSGITVSTTDFNDRWDSGQIGFILVSKAKIRKEFNVKRISKKLLTTVKDLLEGEVKTYDQYLTNDVYGFKMLIDEVEQDACWGFFGLDMTTNGILDYVNDNELKEVIINS